MHCNELANTPVGNPNNSILVNDMIKIVINKEVWKQGKPSKARKTFTEQEYEADIQIIDGHENVKVGLFVSLFLDFKWQELPESTTLPNSCMRIWKKINSTQGIQLLIRFAGPKMSMKSETPLIRFWLVRRSCHTVSWLRFWHGLSSLSVKGTQKTYISLLELMVKMTLF